MKKPSKSFDGAKMGVVFSICLMTTCLVCGLAAWAYHEPTILICQCAHPILMYLASRFYEVMFVDIESLHRMWYDRRGYLHREDGPAVELADGSKVWYVNNHMCRSDGPVWETSDGKQMYRPFRDDD